jgi:outer membrane protein assembly factor BamD
VQTAIQDYPGTPAIKDALQLLADCYEKLGLQQLRDDTLRVMNLNFPPQENQTPAQPWWKVWSRFSSAP